jgi:hypothetical protein
MRPSDNRRSGTRPGRRLPSCLRRAQIAVACGCAVLACAAPAGLADQTVVSATVYPGAQGRVATRSATLSALQTCQPYSGPNPMYLYPGQQPFQAPPDSTWTVSEVLQCALGVPPAQLSDVQVGTATRGFEAPLSGAALTDPSQYQDPAAPGALPIISSDGAEDQNTYVRPWRGGSDANATDQVVQSGQPVALLVYLNGSLLTVTATQQTVSHTSSTRTIRLGATVRDGSGAAIAPTALTWSWTFGDGGGSTTTSPTHRFSSGTYYVTVAVTDGSTGSGGTATMRVSFGGSGPAGTGSHNGNPKATKSKNPSGADHGSPKPTSGARGQKKSASQTTTTQTTTTQTTTTTTNTTTTTATTTPTTTTPSTSTTATSTSRTLRTHRSPTTRTQPAVPPNAPVVSGQLISDVTPLPASASPLVHLTPAVATPAAEVRQASHISATPAVGGALAVGLLLALGAGRELRGRHRWRLDDGGD